MTVRYEWDIETITACETEEHEAGEVLDHHHVTTYAEALRALATMGAPEIGYAHRVVLVRDDDDRRAWAEVEAGALPEHFTDADGCDYRKVPQRFHDELARAR